MADEASLAALLDIGGNVARLTLNRPRRMNAVDAGMHRDLRVALDRIEASTGIAALILTGSGDAFCAGQDLSERAAMLEEGEVDLAASLEDDYNPLVRRLAALPFPVIAAVNGVAAGAGAAVAIGCDIVLAARSARFQFAFAKVGLGADSGISWLLPRLVGQARALGLALTADAVDAETAERIGLIWRAVDDGLLAEEAERLARRFAEGPRAALAAIKHQLRAAATQSFDHALDAERDAQGQLGLHQDYRRAVTAFVTRSDRRRPQHNQRESAR